MDSDKDIKGKITLVNNESEATLPIIPTPVLEALYQTVTGTKESVETARRKPKKATIDDIQQLYHLLQQWSEPFSPISTSTSFVMMTRASDRLKGSSRVLYRSFDSLKRHEIGKTHPSLSLIINFSVLVQSDERRRLENIEASIDLSARTPQYLYVVSENDRLGYLDRIWHDEEDRTLGVIVKYTDYVMARGLVSVIDDWYDSLDDRKVWIPTPSMRFLYLEQAFDPFGPSGLFLKVFPLVITSIISFGLVDNLPFVNFSDPYHVVGTVMCAILIYVLVDVTLRSIIKHTGELIGRQIVPLLLINAGDKKVHDNFDNDIEKNTKREDILIRSIGLALAVSIIAGVIVNLI